MRAPFDGRVLAQQADVGQVVTVGAPLAEVFATDYVEVRLPLRNADLAFVNLPEASGADPLPVILHSNLGEAVSWRGQIVRTEGAIDETARQLHVVAQINDPFGIAEAEGRGAKAPRVRPLKIGEYVTAEVTGKQVPGALVVPSEAIYQNAYVYVVEQGRLQRRPIEIAWQNGVDSLVASGLAAGDALVMTPLGQVISGTAVRIANADGGPTPPQPGMGSVP